MTIVDDPSIERVRVKMLPGRVMDADNAARYYGVKKKTMAMWRWQGKGPRWFKVGGRVRYTQDDLDADARKDV